MSTEKSGSRRSKIAKRVAYIGRSQQKRPKRLNSSRDLLCKPLAEDEMSCSEYLTTLVSTLLTLTCSCFKRRNSIVEQIVAFATHSTDARRIKCAYNY